MGRRLVSFDWALKRLLRNKANFGILEGFLCELLGGDIHIDEMLESESSRDFEEQKANRVDLKCRDASGRILLIELQHERQDDFLNRAVFGVSRALTEQLQAGETYGTLPKVISINLVYFNLGHGKDYVYHGTTTFVGIHTHDTLTLSESEKKSYQVPTIAEVMPEYYLLKINAFDRVAKDGLDEWIVFLKTQEIPPTPRGKGLQEAKKVLDVLQLSEAERRSYEDYQDDLHQRASMVASHYGRGQKEGLKKGREEGREEGRKEGIEHGLRVAILSLVEVLGLAMSKPQLRQLESMGELKLSALLQHIKEHKSWQGAATKPRSETRPR